MTAIWRFKASKVAAAEGSVTLTASGSVQVTAGADSTAFSRKDESAGFMRLRMDKPSDSRTTTVASEVSAGKDVTLAAQTGDVAVQAARIAAREALRLTATQGGVQILTARDSTFHSEDHSSTGMVWQSQKGSGKVDETTRYAALTAGDGIAIIAAKGVTAEIHTGGDRDCHRHRDPGRGGRPVGRGDGRRSPLTGAGGAMASAAFTSLVTQASLSVINNQGNLGAVLKGLGSSNALKSPASAVVTAGIISGVANSGALDGLTANADQSAQLTTLEQLQDTAVNSLSKAIVNTAANEIGDAAAAGDINTAAQYIAHAALGCGVGALGGGDCASGATGAMIGKVAGELYKFMTPGERSQAELEGAFAEWKQKGVDIAKLSAALGAFVAGLDVNSAAATGANAAENNAMKHIARPLDIAVIGQIFMHSATAF